MGEINVEKSLNYLKMNEKYPLFGRKFYTYPYI